MKRRKRLAAAERRSTIITGAMQLFSERGFHGATINDIARNVGVNPAILYQHFKSKKELYDAVLHESACQREDYHKVLNQPDGELEDALRDITHIFVGNTSRNPSILKIELHSLLDGSSENHDFFEGRWKSFTDLVAYMVEEINEEEGLTHINPKIAGLIFQGMIREALITKCLGSDDRFSDMAISEIVDEQVSLFLKILSPGSQAP